MMTNFLWSRLPGLGTNSDLIPQGCFSRWPVSVHRLVGGCCHDMCISFEPSHHQAHRSLVGGCSTSLIYHRTNHDSMIICYMVSELGPSNALSSNPRYWNLRPRAYNWILPNPGRADEEDMALTNALIRTGSAVSQTGNDMQQMSVKNATNVSEKCNKCQWKKKCHADPCSKCFETMSWCTQAFNAEPYRMNAQAHAYLLQSTQMQTPLNMPWTNGNNSSQVALLKQINRSGVLVLPKQPLEQR